VAKKYILHSQNRLALALGISISIGHWPTAITFMVGNDTCLIVGIMPNPGQAKICGAWCHLASE